MCAKYECDGWGGIQTPRHRVPSKRPASSNPSEPPAKRTRFDFEGDTITVMVGSQEIRYQVHKKIVCQASDFFRAACAGNWRESKEGVVKLPEVQAHTFDVYTCWIYTGDVEVLSDSAEAKGPPIQYHQHMNCDTYRRILTLLIHAFSLGDVLQDTTFKNAIVDEFATLSAASHKIPQPPMVDLMWNTISHESTFAKAFVDVVAVHVGVQYFSEHTGSYPVDFVVEIAKACVRDRELSVAQRGLGRPRCFYHDHEGGKGKTKWCC